MLLPDDKIRRVGVGSEEGVQPGLDGFEALIYIEPSDEGLEKGLINGEMRSVKHAHFKNIGCVESSWLSPRRFRGRDANSTLNIG